MNKLHLEPHDYKIYYVNIDLRRQYGISVAESQTFLLAKRPPTAMSEEKRLPFARYDKHSVPNSFSADTKTIPDRASVHT